VKPETDFNFVIGPAALSSTHRSAVKPD